MLAVLVLALLHVEAGASFFPAQDTPVQEPSAQGSPARTEPSPPAHADTPAETTVAPRQESDAAPEAQSPPATPTVRPAAPPSGPAPTTRSPAAPSPASPAPRLDCRRPGAEILPACTGVPGSGTGGALQSPGSPPAPADGDHAEDEGDVSPATTPHPDRREEDASPKPEAHDASGWPSPALLLIIGAPIVFATGVCGFVLLGRRRGGLSGVTADHPGPYRRDISLQTDGGEQHRLAGGDLFPSARIGSKAGCEIILTSGGVAPIHAHLRARDGRVWIRPHKGQSIILNDRMVDDEERVSSGDRIRFGQSDYWFEIV